MNPDTRNLIAAICLSMSVLIGYQILFGEPTQQKVKKEQQLVDKNNEPSIELPKDNNTSLTEVTKKIRNIDRINIVNDELEGSISLLGARIDDLVLKNYRKTLDPESDQIRFLKKIGSAIVRNKIKRRLKSIIRELLKYKDKYFDLSFNYILICKKEIVKVSYDELENELMDKFKSNRAS